MEHMKALNLLIVLVTNSVILSVAFVMLYVCVESNTANYRIARSLLLGGKAQSITALYGVLHAYAFNDLPKSFDDKKIPEPRTFAVLNNNCSAPVESETAENNLCTPFMDQTLHQQ